VLENIDVVCATCIGCGMGPLDSRTFPFIVIDEAAQARMVGLSRCLQRWCCKIQDMAGYPLVNIQKAIENGHS